MVRNMIKVSFLDATASHSGYPCQSVGQSLIVSDLEIAITSPSFASLLDVSHQWDSGSVGQSLIVSDWRLHL